MEPVALLRRIVSIDSVFGNERKLAEFLERELKERGFRTRRIPISPGRFSVVGDRGSRGRPILLFGHMDTVPPYGKWAGKPTSLRQKGDRLCGLGAFDMKAGVAAILAATEEKSGRRIRVAFSVDEENISQGSYAMLRAGALRGVEAAISAEISTSKPCLGTGEITLGRRGRCVIEVEVPGRSAHGAQADRGISAISEASRLVLELDRLNGSLGSHPLLPPPTQFVRRFSAESTSLSVPETAVIELDRHTVVPETPESVLRQVRSSITFLYRSGKFSPIDGRRMTARLAPRPNPYLLPYVTSQGNPSARLLTRIVREKTGRQP